MQLHGRDRPGPREPGPAGAGLLLRLVLAFVVFPGQGFASDLRLFASWADALAVPAPQPVLDANVMPGGWGAMPSPTSGAVVSKLPLGGVVGRESDGAVHRIGFRSSLIPRSPVAG